MKKNIKLITFIITLLLLLPIETKAASCNIKVSGGSTAVVGSTVTVNVTLSSSSPIGSWEFLVNYNTSYLKLISSNTESGGTSSAGYASNGNTKSKTYTLKFQALKSGTTSVKVGSYLVYAYDESQMSVSSSSGTIKIMTQAELEASYSKDNNLKSLEIEGYSLSPEFNKDTLEYTVNVPSTVTSVNIKATKNDNTAEVSGDGEHEVVEGNNRFEIKVRAQNGSEKTYVINVEVEDLNPIKVKIGNEEYTIVKRKDSLTQPSLYEEATVVINEMEIPCFKNETNQFVLVGVKDADGKISLAIYNEKENTYQLYNEFTSSNLVLYLTSFPNPLDGYLKGTMKINNMEVEVYRYNENSRFVICYAMNVQTGKYDYYSYDTEENTFQIFNEEEIHELKKEMKTYLYVIIAFGSGLVIAVLLIICMLSSKRKKSKKRPNKENEKKETIQTEEAKEKVITNDDDFQDLLKEMKKKKRNENKK